MLRHGHDPTLLTHSYRRHSVELRLQFVHPTNITLFSAQEIPLSPL